jgi:hypothetical protein
MPERDAGDPVAFLADLHQWSKATLAGRTARSAPPDGRRPSDKIPIDNDQPPTLNTPQEIKGEEI